MFCGSILILRLFIVAVKKDAIGIWVEIVFNVWIPLCTADMLTVSILQSENGGMFPFCCVVVSFFLQYLMGFSIQAFHLLR